MVQRRSSWTFFAPLLGGFLFLNTLLLFTHAQSYTPFTTWGSVSVFIEGKALYVQGGVTATNSTTSQSYSLDLSTAWDVSSPAFKKLPPGVDDYLHLGALLTDNSTLYMISNATHSYYNLLTGDLTQFTTANRLNGTNSGLKGLTDPTTGIIYVPNGYYGSADTVGSLLKYSPGAKTSTPGSMPTGLSNITMYAASWNTLLSTFLVHGGRTRGSIDGMQNGLFRYNVADGSWASVTTSGQVPPATMGSCLVQAYGGTKMVLFGGDGIGSVAQSGIYVLDVQTWTWTKGADAGAVNARGGAACAVTNNLFVAQGGWTRDPYEGVTKQPTIIYNLKTGVWQNRFDPAASTGGPSPGPEPPSNPNLGAIIGGVAAGVVVICGLAFWGYRRRKAKNVTKTGQTENQHFNSASSEHKPPTQPSPTVGPGPIPPMPVAMYQQPANVSPNMPIVYSAQHQLPPQPAPAPVPVNNYYQQPQPTPYQIPVVHRPDAYPQQQHYQPQFDQQQQQQQQQQQYQAQYEQQLQQQQLQQKQQQQQQQQQHDLEQQRIKESQLQQERALAQQIEAQMAQLQMMKDQRAASESPNAQNHVNGPQAPFSAPSPAVSSYDESNMRPVSTISPVNVVKHAQVSPPPRANPQYIQPESNAYANEYNGPRNPQLQG
ncbi:hypothetical protein BGZ82_010892 [Podila clonocystis]|nr:hypothetical protein BGZ82_010892 [Podila clonocystis]